MPKNPNGRGTASIVFCAIVGVAPAFLRIAAGGGLRRVYLRLAPSREAGAAALRRV